MKHDKDCPYIQQRGTGAGVPCTCPSPTDTPEEEDCKCELDGFQGAMTSQNCPIHKEVKTAGDWEEIRYKWRGYAVVDDSFEDSGISFNADRIADWWIAQLKSLLSQAKSEGYDEGAHEATMVCNEKTIPFALAKMNNSGKALYERGRKEMAEECLAIIEREDPSTGRNTGATYWGNTLRTAIRALLNKTNK